MPIKLCLGLVLKAILEVEERVLLRHVNVLKHKDSELVDVVINATHLLEPSKMSSHFIFRVAWGKVLL